MRDGRYPLLRAALLAAAVTFLPGIPCAGQAARPARTDKAPERVQTVSICELVRRPRLYHGKLVRVSAMETSGYHGGLLFGVCGGKTEYLSLSYDCPDQAACAKVQSVLARDLRPDTKYGVAYRVGVLVVGRFYGPKSLGGPYPSGSFPSDFTAVTVMGCGYGHMASFDYAIEVREYERTWPVPAGVPWGDTREDKIAREVEALDNEWQLAVRDARTDQLGRILADEYTLTDQHGAVRDKARFLSDLKKPGEPMLDFIPRCERFRRSGRVGVINGLLTNELSIEEGEEELVVRYRNVYERSPRTRGWRLVSTRLSALPGTKRAGRSATGVVSVDERGRR